MLVTSIFLFSKIFLLYQKQILSPKSAICHLQTPSIWQNQELCLLVKWYPSSMLYFAIICIKHKSYYWHNKKYSVVPVTINFPHSILHYLVKVSLSDSPKDLVNGVVGRQSAVEDVEMAFQTLWDVITTSARMDHGSHHLDVYNVCKFTRLLQVVEPFLFNHLTCNLIGDLKAEEDLFVF